MKSELDEYLNLTYVPLGRGKEVCLENGFFNGSTKLGAVISKVKDIVENTSPDEESVKKVLIKSDNLMARVRLCFIQYKDN